MKLTPYHSEYVKCPMGHCSVLAVLAHASMLGLIISTGPTQEIGCHANIFTGLQIYLYHFVTQPQTSIYFGGDFTWQSNKTLSEMMHVFFYFFKVKKKKGFCVCRSTFLCHYTPLFHGRK